ncbi:hypothetical protein [Roseateles sp.]|uniref:hypothetical protein n=1 Tax=Roseateles sp. TaxID=1971397 RepID=UPI003D119491
MKSWRADPRQVADPFAEQALLPLKRKFNLLGIDIEFCSDSCDLLALADAAFADLPSQVHGGPALTVELRLLKSDLRYASEPPAARMVGGAGLLGAVMDAENLALINVRGRHALVQVSEALLAWPYHIRYELIEFAVFTLASRAQGYLALHAGCVGIDGNGALLIGESGAGKSTLTLHALGEGLDFMTEDACFVDPVSLRTTGIANYLHMRQDAVTWVGDTALRNRILSAPIIRRRSGVEKFELNLRGGWASLAAEPLRLAHFVFAAPAPASDGELLRRLDAEELLHRLQLSQPYAASQPGWAVFAQRCARLHGWELRRGSHPRAGALALKALLMA